MIDPLTVTIPTVWDMLEQLFASWEFWLALAVVVSGSVLITRHRMKNYRRCMR